MVKKNLYSGNYFVVWLIREAFFLPDSVSSGGTTWQSLDLSDCLGLSFQELKNIMEINFVTFCMSCSA